LLSEGSSLSITEKCRTFERNTEITCNFSNLSPLLNHVTMYHLDDKHFYVKARNVTLAKLILESYIIKNHSAECSICGTYLFLDGIDIHTRYVK